MSRQGLMDDCGYDFFDVSDCANYENCREDAYNDGYADAIDKVIKFLEAEFLMQNNPNSKFVETIVLHRDFIDELKQLKEQKNDR